MGPSSGPSLRILAGANLTDTISTAPTQGLVVEVRGDDGRVADGVEVRFESAYEGRMEVSGVAQPFFSSLAAAVTDASGRAVVRTRMSTRAGSAWIAVHVPLYGQQDTARYDVLPGAAVRVQISPKDTAITIGSSIIYRASIVDRAGNPRTDPLLFDAVGSALTIDGGGRAAAVAIGPARVRVRAANASTIPADSASAVVVPQARIAWSQASYRSALVLSDLSGVNQVLVDETGLAASWEPGGARYVYVHGESSLFIGNVGGVPASLPTPGIANPTWPEWSSDAQWIYFQGSVSSGGHVFRVRPDGTQLEKLTQERQSIMPSPSPDGRRVVYVTGGQLMVQDLQTGATYFIAGTQYAQAPRWSPDGAWIAYTSTEAADNLVLVRPDGSELQTIAGRTLAPGINWSPDSRWIIGTASTIQLVDVAARVIYPLHWYGHYPAWRR